MTHLWNQYPKSDIYPRILSFSKCMRW